MTHNKQRFQFQEEDTQADNSMNLCMANEEEKQQAPHHAITIEYGPSRVGKDITHSTNRIQPLIDQLRSLGFEVNLSPISSFEQVKVIASDSRDKLLFTCNIRELDYGGGNQMSLMAVKEALKHYHVYKITSA